MRTLLLISVVLAALSACGPHASGSGGGGGGGGAATGGGQGGGGHGNSDAGVDAGTPDAGFKGVCDPATQQGCDAGMRCTFPAGGPLGCTADGTLDLGAPCTVPDSGFDDCKRGTACAQGQCAALCPVTSTSCDATHTCAQLTGFFQPQFSAPLAGACVPGCDPVTQVRATDGAPACGSPDPSNPTWGCYGFPGQGFSCQPAGPATEISDVTVDSPTVNACAPGFEPLLRQDSDTFIYICVAFCRPAPTSVEMPTQAAGAADSGYTCPDRGALGTHECRYFWAFENPPYDDVGNSVGYCMDYTRYHAGIGYTHMPYPSCTALSDSAYTLDLSMMLSDAQVFACVPHP
jgi:hypothetical protein